MNICIVSTYSCTFEDFSAIVDEYEESFKEFITEYELVKVNDHKSIMMCHCTDMEAMGEMMSSPEMKEWDKENNCVDIVYSLEKINQFQITKKAILCNTLEQLAHQQGLEPRTY